MKSGKTNIRSIKVFVIIFFALYGACTLPGRAGYAAVINNLEVTHDTMPVKKDGGVYQLNAGNVIDVTFDSDQQTSDQASIIVEDSQFAVQYDDVLGKYTTKVEMPYSPDEEVEVFYQLDEKQSLFKAYLMQPPTVTDSNNLPLFGVRVIVYFVDEYGLRQIWTTPLKRQLNPKTTDFTGTYSFYVDPGNYILEVEGAGYETFSQEFEITDHSYLNQNISLQVAAIEDIDNVMFDSSIVGLVDTLIQHIEDLRKDEEVIKITREIVKPASWLIMLSTLLAFIFTMVSQFGFSFAQLPNLGLHSVQLLGQVFKTKSGKHKWGRLYEHFSQEPVPMAAIMLFHEPDHKLAHMTLSEIDGMYGFPRVEGSYSVFVSRKGFIFPPQSDQWAYKGDAFTTIKETVPNINLTVDLDEKVKLKSGGALMLTKLFSSGQFLLMIAGLVAGGWTLVMHVSYPTLILELFYIWLISHKIGTYRTSHRINKIIKQNRKADQ